MTHILTIIALLFATPVAAEGIVIDCNGALFRYVEGFFENSVEERVDGEWEAVFPAVASEDWLITKQEVKIKDLAGISEYETIRTTENQYYPKGTSAKVKEVYDFQLPKISMVIKYSNKEKEEKLGVECEKR